MSHIAAPVFVVRYEAIASGSLLQLGAVRDIRSGGAGWHLHLPKAGRVLIQPQQAAGPQHLAASHAIGCGLELRKCFRPADSPWHVTCKSTS